MGKISEYQQRQLVSSAVGVPQADRSGEIMAQGILQGAQGVIGLLAERKALATDLKTDVKMSDMAIAYGEAKGKAMTLYRDTPDKFPAAVRDHGMKLVEDFTANMEPGEAQSFRTKASAFVANDTANSVSWSRQRDQQIIIANVEKGYNNLELASQNANSPQMLQSILTAIDKHSAKSQNFVDYSSDNALKERTKTAAKDNALQGLILKDSRAAVSALESGEFLEIVGKDATGKEVRSPLLSPTENAKYLKLAKNAAIYDATVEQYRSLTTAGAQISDMSTRLKDGSLPISEVNLQLEWARLHEKETDVNGNLIIPDNYIKDLETVRDLVLKQDPRTAEQRRADATEYTTTWRAAWDKYLFDKPTDASAKGGKAGIRDYNDVISLYGKALRANQNGVISDVQFASIRKILDTDLKAKMGSKNSSVGITEALNSAATKSLGPWTAMWNPKENIYSAGYHQIGEYFRKRKDLSIADRQIQTEDMLVKYTETIDALPEEQKSKIQNADKAAADILNGYEKEGKTSPGLFDRLTVIKGKDGAIYHKNQVINRAGGTYMVTGMNENGEPLVRQVKVK